MNCYKCPDKFYMIENSDSCYDYIPNNYYLDGNILKKCYELCFNCFGPKNTETMNCLGCINNDYFYRNDTYECIKKDEFKKRENLEFTRLSGDNFWIFICIFVASIIMVFFIFCFYKKQQEQKNIRVIRDDINNNNNAVELQNQIVIE